MLYTYKFKTDEDVVSKKCAKCQKHRAYFDDLCHSGNPTLNERKEYKVVNFIQSHLNSKLHDFMNNRIVPNDDNIKYGPDLLFSFSDNAIIVEIDEFQQKRYDPEQEELRMSVLQSILDCNVLFIRFNPDKYTQNNVIKDVKLEEKMNCLAEKILNYVENPISESIKIIKLYYDE